MSDPKNSVALEGGGRAYIWKDAVTGVETQLLSVTSIRRLCGEQFNLVNWQLANVVDVAMGTAPRITIGPRGGVKKTRPSKKFPSEFVERYMATEGVQEKIDELRKWMRGQADEPRDIAALRGTIVHESIEKNIRAERAGMDYVVAAYANLSDRDKRKVRGEVSEDDVNFIQNGLRQYEDMRVNVPFVILGREVQVWNLTAGYGGTADVMIWFLGHWDDENVFVPLPGITPEDVDEWQRKADHKAVTIEDIKRVGGSTVLGDWKTSTDVYTDQVVQITAYMIAEFIGNDGVVDERLTAILKSMVEGALIHIRPDKWAVDFVDLEDPVVLAFLGSCAFARFLATYPRPEALFKHTLKGAASAT